MKNHDHHSFSRGPSLKGAQEEGSFLNPEPVGPTDTNAQGVCEPVFMYCPLLTPIKEQHMKTGIYLKERAWPLSNVKLGDTLGGT